MQRQFLRIISRKPDYVKSYCHDLNIPFLFAGRRWILENQSN